MIEEGDQAEEVDGLLGGDICKFHTSENHDTFTGKLSLLENASLHSGNSQSIQQMMKFYLINDYLDKTAAQDDQQDDQ